MSHRKIFITGLGSFIAGELVRACTAGGIQYHGVDLVQSGKRNLAVADISTDDLAPLIEDDTEAIVHLAAMSRDGDFKKDPGSGYRANLIGTANVMAAAKARGVKQVIFASSEWVYGDVSGSKEQRESDLIDIAACTSEYAMSKLIGENILRLGLSGSDVDLTILRFAIVYGSRASNWSAVEALFNSVLTKEEISVGSLRTARRFIHVKDIVSGIIAALGLAGNHTLNLSGDCLVTLHEIIEASRVITGKSPRIAETGSVVSIRNPVNDYAKEVLAWKPEINLNAGLMDLAKFLT